MRACLAAMARLSQWFASRCALNAASYCVALAARFPLAYNTAQYRAAQHERDEALKLNRYQFEVLAARSSSGKKTLRDIAAKGGFSLGSASNALRELKDAGCIDSSGRITEQGKCALQPYRVSNAVILAAGMATRFAPLSFEKPKAMFEVHGEVLIERLIRQLQQAGVSDITVVVGYMKETFFYLEDAFGVKIVVNSAYADRNNHASLFCVREQVGNTYVCCSDEYYEENVFSPYVFRPYVSVVHGANASGKYVVSRDNANRVTSIARAGSDAWYCAGPAYFDQAFSQKLLGFIAAEYDEPAMRDKLWDDVLADHISQLEIYAKPFADGIIYEFETVADLTAFDRDFFANVDSRILDNICKTLGCVRDAITDVAPVKAGLTNLSTLFSVRGEKYIYRHPGTGTEEIVNRHAETFALRVAKELGLDDTFIYEDPDEGWKISRYIEGCTELDYTNRAQVAQALRMVRTLHTSGKVSPYSFDFYQEGVALAGMLRDMNYPLPRDFDALAARVGDVAAKMHAEAGKPVLCHNDFYGPNLLVRGSEMRLIDWEYAAMGDAACDLGNFVAQGSGYGVDQALDILPLYYGRPATCEEQRHCLAAVGVVGWYWYVWAMYKGAMGNPVGEWLYIWYRAAKCFTEAAEERYA